MFFVLLSLSVTIEWLEDFFVLLVTRINLSTDTTATTTPDENIEKQVVFIPDDIVVRDLAEKLSVTPAKIVSLLVKNGVMANMNERIDFLTAEIIADDLGFVLQMRDVAAEKETAKTEKAKELLHSANEGSKQSRPPVVVVMGHVDHGKTTLLDTIRATNVVADEAGAITQHIGAYQTVCNDRLITFIDTPGHEAFTAMRSRGANVADVAILVVAADDGMQPQTKEAIEIIKKAHLATVVAISKIDKPSADVERVKGELAESGLTPEAWGGDTMMVEVSAKAGTGIEALLELVLLVADVRKDTIVADPTRAAIGTIIESHVDRGEGPVATTIVQTGTLHVGDFIQVGEVAGKIKALRDYTGALVEEAGPSMPIRILGLKELPSVGDIMQVVNASDVKGSLKKKKGRTKKEVVFFSDKHTHVGNEADEDQKILPIIFKADTVGSLEAALAGLDDLRHPEVVAKMLYKSLGNITEKDVLQAEATGALLLGFNVEPTLAAQEVARSRQVKIYTYKIVYELIEKVRLRLEALLDAEVVRTDIGTLEVRGIFRSEKKGMIIGGIVKSGDAENGARFRVERDGELIGKGTVSELRKGQEKAKKVTKGNECGLRFTGNFVVAEGDLLTFYTEETRERTLEKIGDRVDKKS